jgi:formylglycine-generating enzyme required for sulfatase activity
MADIFISYAKKDREKVEPIALALMEQGWSVFWDRNIPGGRTWDEVIEEEIEAAKCIIVVWSNISKSSRWVRAEAEEGLKRGILVPVSVEDTNIPLLFRPIQSVRLIHWEGDSNHPQFVKLISDLSPILGPSPLKVKEEEEKRAEAARKTEEARQKKEAEAKQKAEEEQKHRAVKEESKPSKPEPDAIKPSEPHKRSNALKLVAVAGVVALLIAGIWWYISDSKKIRPRTPEQSSAEPESVGAKPQAITNAIGMKFVLIPSGSFTMGSQLSPDQVAKRFTDDAEWHRNEQPPHSVKITKTFYLQTVEVSQGQWIKVMGDNPSRFKDCGDDCPVEGVSWDDAQKFISKLNQMDGTNKYRLPTEAEWEYACRAGTTTPFFTGDCISADQANYNGKYPGNICHKGKNRAKTVRVGSFQPNAWGLYDMHGNVWEWVQDRYGHYSSISVVDPKGPEKGEWRVLRGGSWGSVAGKVRSASRIMGGPVYTLNYSSIGFRVARDF